MPSLSPAPALAPAIVWFRRDLRLEDNPALQAAVGSRRPVVPLYVLDESPQARPLGGALKWWLDGSLAALSQALERLGSRLILRRGDPAQIIPALVREIGGAAVCWNLLTDPGATAQDQALRTALPALGAEVVVGNAAFLLDPGSMAAGSGAAYKVFTPFWRAARARIGHPELAPAPAALRAPASWPASDDLAGWRLHPSDPDWSAGFGVWKPGEAGAQQQLQRFVDHALSDYTGARDRPGEEGSSRLSPHLRWGEVGPRQVWRAVEQAVAHRGGAEAQAEKFFAELGWREFNNQTLLTRPDLASADFKSGFETFPWRRDPAGLQAWRRGRTGYPVVDAGMRELWATGWMHNRVRLIAASFLVKHLLIDWREGERWFWDTLVDADPANNAANWQWIAGTGADAAPFFRIFNPVLQGEKFDSGGAYVRRWVPELARLPDRFIHAPWTAPAAALDAAGVELGRDYPRPIVDHAKARRRALEALAARGAER